MRTDSHGRQLCAGGYADGAPCRNLAVPEMTFDGVGFCGRHGNAIVKRQQAVKEDLIRYKRYQEMAYGAIVQGWGDGELMEARAGLVAHDRSALTETSNARIDAHLAAIAAELKRRQESP